jgi:hypothetical protein
MSGVFIIGSGRSGTTFLQRIFDSHPQTLCLHEPDTLARTNNPPAVPAVEDYRELKPAAAAYIDKLTRIRGLRAIQKRPTFSKSYRSGLARSLRESTIFAYQGLEKALGKRVSSWRVPEFADTSQVIPVLKSVEAVPRLPLFARASPGMKFVHIMRHPCGYISSQLRGHRLGKMPSPRIFQAQMALPMAQEHGLTPDMVAEFDPLTTAAWTWVISNDFVFRQTKDLPNVRVLLYDELCDDLMAESQALLEWCNIPWHTQTDEFLSRLLAHDSGAHAYHDTVRNPRSAAHRWRREMPEADKALAMDIVRQSPAGRAFDEIDRKFQQSSDNQEL